MYQKKQKNHNNTIKLSSLKLIAIAAVGENNELGKENNLLWHLPDDFKRFKKLTSYHHIIMGRKTFESFPKPLPNRTHIVITRQKDYPDANCIVVKNIEEALDKVKEEKVVFVIGGGEIYRQFMPFINHIELTRVHASFKADTFFPNIDSKIWEITHQEFHLADEFHLYSFSFITYTRKPTKAISI